MSKLKEIINQTSASQKLADKAFLEMINEIFVTYPLIKTFDLRALRNQCGSVLGVEFIGFNSVELRWSLSDKKAALIELDLKESDIGFIKNITLDNLSFYLMLYSLLSNKIPSSSKVRLTQNQVKELIKKVDI